MFMRRRRGVSGGHFCVRRMIPVDRKKPVDTHIGQRLKEYRQHRRLTVRELADAAALMSSRRKAAADNEATMVAALAVAVGASAAAASDAGAGEKSSLTTSADDTAVGSTTLQLDASDAANALLIIDGANTDTINLPGHYTINAAGSQGRGDRVAYDPPMSAAGEQASAQSTSVENGFIVSNPFPFTQTASGNKDHSAFQFKPNVDHHATVDPGINLDSIPKHHLLQHPADNLLHIPAQPDHGVPAQPHHGADPAHHHVDGNQSANADDGNAHHGAVPSDLPTLTALSSDLSGDDSTQPFKTNFGHHANADPKIDDIAKEHPEHPAHPHSDNFKFADNDNHPGKASHDYSKINDIAKEQPEQPAHPHSDNFKFAPAAGSARPGHATGKDKDISVQPSADPKIGDIAKGHPEHPAHPHSDVNQLASFKFADEGSADSGHLAHPHFDNAKVPGTVMSNAASDQFVFEKGHDKVADVKPDMIETDHVVADIRHLLHTAHDANAAGALDPNHTTAPQDMTKVQLPHHHGDFHFA